MSTAELTHALPPVASHYLETNFRDGFLFDEFREDKDDDGHRLFLVWVNDGSRLHQLIFTDQGVLKNHDILPAFEEDLFSEDSDVQEFHEDDY